ncbi:MAG TPA: transposase family protein [Trebonia sp.]|nr:transposase family protein [Trebonia sp.]
MLVIAFLRTNPTQAELAQGFGISPVTCWRYIGEGIAALAGRGRRISLKDVAALAVKMGWDYVIVDGVHVPTVTFGRKTGGQRAFYSGKHKRHGLNVQAACSPDGELLRAAAPRPGATVDITAAREAGIAETLLVLIGVLAGNARLKYWKVLASELRCRPGQCTAVVKAVLALHYMEHDPFEALRAA